MKRQNHPQYQIVLFEDTSTGARFLCGTTLQPEEKAIFEGKEYPIFRVAISSASHPLYTGTSGLVDTEGRVDKFRRRYAGQQPKPVASPAAKSAVGAAKTAKPAAKKPAPKAKAKATAVKK